MSAPKIKPKKWYCAVDVAVFSFEMAEIIEQKIGDQYILRNKATRRGVLKCHS